METYNIFIPYVVRFVWTSGEAKSQWMNRIIDARKFIINDYPKILVDKGIAPFAPALRQDLHTQVLGKSVVSNHYPARWNTFEATMRSMSNLVRDIGVYGIYDEQFDINGRWDLNRDLYQLALAPDCCKKAYFESKYNDPYHDLFGKKNAGINRIASGSMNSLLSPFGLFISPIVPCKLNCEHAHAKSIEIAEMLKQENAEIYDTLKMVVEMPIRIDSYRGMAIVDTPMFIGTYGTDAYKEKHVLDVKPSNPEVFSYSHDWVANGTRFPFRGQFSNLFGG